MAAPTLTKHEFWLIAPSYKVNYIYNPSFDVPKGSGATGIEAYRAWSTNPGAATITHASGDYVLNADGTFTRRAVARRGACCARLNCDPGNATSKIYYGSVTGFKLNVTNDKYYTFSADVKGTEGKPHAIIVNLNASPYTTMARKDFTATGRWERQSLTFKATSTCEVQAGVVRYSGGVAVGGNQFVYTDGWQFEEGAATTFISGDEEGFRTGYSEYRWMTETGTWKIPKRCPSARYGWTWKGGQLLKLSSYCHILNVVGLGSGEYNQLTTPLTTGGEFYQGHMRKSRDFSIEVVFEGRTYGEIQQKRHTLLNAMRVDRIPQQPIVLRYQGFDDNGREATQPIDIVCIPKPSLQDTPLLPTYQRATLNFTIPSGLLEGAYREGVRL